ncbi:MAG: hypothetical protein R3Y57_02065 [Erysipelotrichaceae bacterium]
MNTVITTCLIVIGVSIISLGYGVTIKKNSHLTYQIAIGFLAYLGFFQLFASVMVRFGFSRNIILAFNLLMALIGVCLLVVNRKKISKPKKIEWFGLVIYLMIMITLAYNSTLGIESFDTHHYLSMINEHQVNDFIGKAVYSTGDLLSRLNVQYDFQTYFVFWANILNLQRIIEIIVSQSVSINIQLFIWASSIMYFILSFALFYEVITYFKVDNKMAKLVLSIFPFLFFSTPYYVSALAFYGNTYRTLIIGFLCFEMYKTLRNQTYTLFNISILSMLASAAISVSSSSLFILIVIFGILVKMMLDEPTVQLGVKFGILLIPVVQFAWYYIGNALIPVVMVFYLFLIIYDYKLNDRTQGFLRGLVSNILSFIPIFFVLITAYMMYKGELGFIFFEKHSYMDMVYDYFLLDTLQLVVLNIIIWSSTIYYLIKGENVRFKRYLRYFICIYNPLTYGAIIKFLASDVYYRMIDGLFNPFTLLLFVYGMLTVLHKHSTSFKMILSIFILVTGYFTVEQMLNKYHHYFIPEEGYDNVLKGYTEGLEVAQALYNDINYYQVEDARVLSQFLEVKAYVPTINLSLNYRTVQSTNAYGINSVEDELFRVFYPRLNAEMETFVQDTDYSRACALIAEKKPDYVIMDNEENYLIAKDSYVILNAEVSACYGESIIYTNDKYTLYRLNWDE